ncbi:CheR family methyltransferase [Anaeromyxobacter dehalogenans]|uniref:protein-glutamate O-methyltransferase n=1 Tax=Anaeromyxobacter dehalogenans (strain 2CP-C) TaxID=290397 RepID=Q2IQS7_ANADE|nr:protein-glutamate O-methyltransferase [Anaeromyxobacter dehalogenans]ABC81156.1 MCP methyltransferase, CheR-type [Anaeromyxobacter dehalogenans 2CP-C]
MPGSRADRRGGGGLPAGPAASRLAGPPPLSPRDFARLGAFIEGRCGIRMPPSKRTLLESRLGRRVRELGLAGFGEYCDHVLGDAPGDEVVRMVDHVTTNKTDFFREPHHFELLVRDVLPALAAAAGAGTRRPLRVWSAGCSTGEEPYTLAMVLLEAARQATGLRFGILGTDLSTRALERARRAEYTEAQVRPVPLAQRRRYLLRSIRDPQVVRVCREVRELVAIEQLNLLDPDYRLRERMDVIFCRNVFIYFERSVQQRVLLRLARALSPGGFLFLGHAESIAGLEVPFDPVAPTVYRLREDA